MTSDTPRTEALTPDPRCRLHGQPREGEWSCSCNEETEWESAEEHIVRMAAERAIRQTAAPDPTVEHKRRGTTWWVRCTAEHDIAGQHCQEAADTSGLRPARRGGRRRLTFDNGRHEDYEAVFVQHPAGEWDRILIARDDGTIAQLLVDLINGAALSASDTSESPETEPGS